MVKSAVIAAGAVIAVLGLQKIFPNEDFSVLQTSVLGAVSAFIINTVYLTLRER